MHRGRGSRGRGSRGGGRGGNGGRLVYVPKEQSPHSADEKTVPGVSVDASSRSESSKGGRKNLETASFDGVTKKFDGLLSSDYPHEPNSEPCGVGKFSPNDGNTKLAQNRPEAESESSNVSSFSLSNDDTIPSSSTLSVLNPTHSTRNRGRGADRCGGRGSGGRHYASKVQFPHSADHYVVRSMPDGAAALRHDASSRSVSLGGGRKDLEIASIDGLLSSDSPHGPNSEPRGVGNLSPNVGNINLTQNIPKAESNVSSFSQSNDDNVHSLSTPSELNHTHCTRNRGRGGNHSGGKGRGGAGMHYVPKGQSPLSGDCYVRHMPDGAAALWDDASSRSVSSGGGRRDSEIASIDGVTKKFGGLLSSKSPHGANSEPCRAGNLSGDEGNSKLAQCVPETQPKPLNGSSSSPYYDNSYSSSLTTSELNVRPKVIESRDQDVENFSPSYSSCTPPVDLMHKKQEPSPSTGGQLCREVQSGKTEFAGTVKDKVGDSDFQLKGFSFDICGERNGSVPKLKPSLRDTNRAIRNEKRQMQGDNIKILRPGMIHLEGYLSLKDQVKLIKSCRELGRGPGGFYQPGYRDGAKLHLKMMCLGKNWDPETSMYDEVRPIDQAKPPPIPDEFQQLVKDAIQKCHRYLESDCREKNARSILPSMSPNICIINYYTKTGMLGLHKDKDESQESLRKGLPVVSISLGDTAEFLYGDERDIDKAVKVPLKSGDVLIFGGKSRHIYHGVSTINPDTAPKALIEETCLKPGRLNLTFREY